MRPGSVELCSSHTSVGLSGRGLRQPRGDSGRGGGLSLEDGVDSVGDAAGSEDGFAVLYSELDHAVVGPDCCCSWVISECAEVGKVGWCQIFVDCIFGSDSVCGWVRTLREDIVLVGEDEVADEG